MISRVLSGFFLFVAITVSLVFNLLNSPGDGSTTPTTSDASRFVPLLCVLIVVGLYYFVQSTEELLPSGKISGYGRRFVAVCVDLYVVQSILLTGLVSIVPLVSWCTQFVAEGSTVQALVFLTAFLATLALGFSAGVFYFLYPLTKGQATLGNYLAGIVIAKDDHTRFTWSQAVLRTILGGIAFCGWPITLLLRRDRTGRLWYEEQTASASHEYCRSPK